MHGGSIRGTCQSCGREHYQSAVPGYFDEGELEELERKAEKEPDKYIDNGDCTVGFGEIDGVQFVYGCPCEMKSLYKYEAFVWSHRFQVIKFLVDVTKERKRRADKDHAGATEVEKAVEGALKREENFGRQQERKAQAERLKAFISDMEFMRYKGVEVRDKAEKKAIEDRLESLLKKAQEIQSGLEKKDES